MIRYKVKTAPTVYPISLDELKRNLHIEDSDTTYDEILQDLIPAVVDEWQLAYGRQILRATYTAYLDEYPDGDEIEIECGPVAAISSVKYYEQGASSLTTVAAANYQLDNIELTARLRFLESFTPDTDRMNVIEIEFTNGWADAASVPRDIKDALILMASERYLNPENQQLNFGMGARYTAAERKSRPYKPTRF